MQCFPGRIDKDEVKNPRLRLVSAWILHVDPLDHFLELWYSYRIRMVDAVDVVVEKILVLMVSYW